MSHFFVFFSPPVLFLAQCVEGVTPGDLLDKPWSAASSLLNPPVLKAYQYVSFVACRVQHAHWLSMSRFVCFVFPTRDFALSATEEDDRVV